MPSKIIAVTVTCHGHEDVVFKVKNDANLEKLMDRYCNQILNKKPSEVVFTYEGIEVKKNDTPLGLAMGDNDVIQVTALQIGGGNV